MRILFASHSGMLTGAPQILYHIARGLDYSRFEPLVVFPSEGPIVDKFRKAEIPTEIINIGDCGFSERHIPMIKALCISKKIDLVHANTIHSYPFIVAASELDIPSFWHVHEMFSDDTMYEPDKLGLKEPIRHSRMIGMTSRACQREFSDFCKKLGVDVPEIALVHNAAVLPERFKSFSPEGSDEVEILSVSSYVERKGLNFLIDAFDMVVEKHPGSRLTILGDGPLHSFMKLYEQAEELGIETKIKFLTPREDVEPILYSADIFVNASLMENLSLSVAEAMAHAKSVVATDVGGTNELLIDGETGLLVPPQDAGAIAEAIFKFTDDEEFARRCGMKARERIASDFSVERQVDRLQRIYPALSPHSGLPEGSAPDRHAPSPHDLIFEALVSVSENLHDIDTKDLETNNKFGKIYEHMEKAFSQTHRDIMDANEGLSRFADQMNELLAKTHQDVTDTNKRLNQLAEQMNELLTQTHREINISRERLEQLACNLEQLACNTEERDRSLSENISSMGRDLRSVEAVIDNLFQKFPFRAYAKLRRLFRRKKA